MSNPSKRGHHSDTQSGRNSAIAVLWRRAATVDLAIPTVDAALEDWQANGGSLAVLGPSGAGRTRTLARAAARLRAAGRTVIPVLPGPHSGAPLARILVDSALPGPPTALPSYRSADRRAVAAAAAIRDRVEGGVWILADDADQIDPVTLLALRTLASRRAARRTGPAGGVLLAGSRSPTWVDQTVRLPPLDERGIRLLLQRLLGSPSPPTSLQNHLLTALQGSPGHALAFLSDCLDQGQLVPGPSGWRLRSTATLGEVTSWNSHARLLGLSPAGVRAGSLVAASVGGLRRADLADLLSLPSTAALDALFQPLVDRQLVHLLDDLIRCPGAAARGLLLDASVHSNPHAVVRPLLRRAERAHISGSASGPSSASIGFDLEATAREDPAVAARIGRTLLARKPTPNIARLTADAMEGAGEARGLIGLLKELLSGPLADQGELWCRLSRLQLDTLGDRTAARDALVVAERHLHGRQPRPLALAAADAALAIADDQPERALATIAVALGPEGPLPEPHEHQLTVDLHQLQARALARSGDLDDALAHLTDPPAGLHEEERESFLLEAGRLLSKARRHLEASERFAAAAAVDQLGQSRVQVHWLEQAAASAYRGGDPSAAVAHWRSAATLAQVLGENGLFGPILISISRVLGELCHFEEARTLARQAHQHAVAESRPALAASAAMMMGDLAAAMRNFEESDRWYDISEEALTGPGADRQRARLFRRRAELAVVRDLPDAEATVQAAATACKRAELIRDRSRVQALQAICHARQGREARIGPTLESAIEPLREHGESAALAEVRVHGALAWLIAGELGAAQATANRALVWAEERGHVALRARAEDLCQQVRSQLDGPGPSGPDETLDRLLEVSMALASERDLDVLLSRINRAALDLIAGDRAFVLLLDEAGNPRVHAAADGHGGDPGKPSSSIVRSAIDRGREIIVSDIDERSEYRDTVSLVGINVRSAMCMPMNEGGRMLGLLYVDSRHIGRRELHQAKRLLRGLAGHAAIAVANARLLAESAERARRAAEVAHDLRSPAASILMAAREVAEEPGIVDWVAETSGLIADQAEKLVGMAERFLAGRPTESRPVDLVELTRRLVRLHAPAARARDRSIVLGTVEPAVVFGDPQELDRALTNLVSNAVRHTPPGTAVRITIREQGGGLRWSIRDRGPGIAADLLPRIFSRGVVGEGGEHGLGLGICQRIVKSHRGRVWAENHRSGGARFVIELPRITDEQAMSIN